jgi:hypothetical protein
MGERSCRAEPNDDAVATTVARSANGRVLLFHRQHPYELCVRLLRLAIRETCFLMQENNGQINRSVFLLF